MPNRLTFDGPVEAGQPDAPSSVASIQKFMWWDARIDEPDRETSFSYTAWPVVGSASAPQLLEAQRTQLAITLPAHIEEWCGPDISILNQLNASGTFHDKQLSAHRWRGDINRLIETSGNRPQTEMQIPRRFLRSKSVIVCCQPQFGFDGKSGDRRHKNRPHEWDEPMRRTRSH